MELGDLNPKNHSGSSLEASANANSKSSDFGQLRQPIDPLETLSRIGDLCALGLLDRFDKYKQEIKLLPPNNSDRLNSTSSAINAFCTLDFSGHLTDLVRSADGSLPCSLSWAKADKSIFKIVRDSLKSLKVVAKECVVSDDLSEAEAVIKLIQRFQPIREVNVLMTLTNSACALLETGEVCKAAEEFEDKISRFQKLFGEDHVVTHLIKIVAKALTTKFDKESSARSVLLEEQLDVPSSEPQNDSQLDPTKPSVVIDKIGFTIQFRLPSPIPTRNELISFFQEMVKEAEMGWARENGTLGAYGNFLSGFSTLGLLTELGPKLYDPDGIYRGRVSGAISAKDAIIAISDDYGFRFNDKSIWAYLEGSKAIPPGWRNGFWKIVADQS